MELPNIKYKGDIAKFIESVDDGDQIFYFKDTDYFLEDTTYSKFVKEIERAVRTSPDYTNYVAYIKGTIGLNFCQAISGVYESKNVQIEMHHGPIFTLYDICETVLEWFIQNKQRINTFRVAEKVLDEHYALRVQTIMFSKTAHEAWHNRDIFTSLGQAFGDIDAFIKMYTPYLSQEQKYKIWNYINLCESNPAFAESFDTGILDLDYVRKYIKL